MKCPKCNSEMEDGIILDAMHVGTRDARWAKSTTMWRGNKEERKMKAHRCKNCGYIELFTQEL